MADDIKPLRSGPGGSGGRVGGLSRPQEPVRLRSTLPARRLRDRIPTRAQLEALIATGRLLLPPRYVRGYFLDLLI